MRTQKEIAKYLKENDDFFGFATEAVGVFLTYDLLKPIIDPTVTEEEIKELLVPYTQENVERLLVDYMNEYGIDKALSHRGISAGRTIEKVKAWLFALGEQELHDFLGDDNNYAPYGVPMLVKVCERYGIRQPESEEWKNMAQGEACSPDCESCLA